MLQEEKKGVIDFKEELLEIEKPKGVPEEVWHSLRPREKDYFVLTRIRKADESVVRRLLYINSDRTSYRFKKRVQEKLRRLMARVRGNSPTPEEV